MASIFDINFEKYDHSFVYSPNSSGKTRLTKTVEKKLKDKNAIFMTADIIENMIQFDGKKMLVGSDSIFQAQNDKIIKSIDKIKIDNTIVKVYKANKANDLKQKSILFKECSFTKKTFSSIYGALFEYCKLHDNHSNSYSSLSIEEMTNIDIELAKMDGLDKVNQIITNKVNLLINDNLYCISPEYKKQLKDILDKIDKRKTCCPLCGSEYLNNSVLIKTIDKNLSKYFEDETQTDVEICQKFINSIKEINKNNANIFSLSDDLNYVNLSNCLRYINNFKIEYAFKLKEHLENYFDKNEYNVYQNNLVQINKINAERKDKTLFLSRVIENANEFISLPAGFRFLQKDGVIVIKSEDDLEELPGTFLSESEKRRLCVSIAFTEIEMRRLEYIIFDDPVDSNDDFFFDITTNAILDVLSNTIMLHWIVLTHEIRMFSLIANRNELQNKIKIFFNLPDPSSSKMEKPTYSLIKVDFKELEILNKHELMIFNNIFYGKTGYECDKELALLSSFMSARNLYYELLQNHKISDKVNKKAKSLITNGVTKFEHYFDDLTSFRCVDLWVLTKNIYKEVKPEFATKLRRSAVTLRKEFIKQNYANIACSNKLLKFILFMMVRVMALHYSFEEKLAVWAKNNISEFNINEFTKAKGIGRKLNYVKEIGIEEKKDQINKYCECFTKCRTLFNNFAHGGSRMFPPYLSVSPLEVTKLEKSIEMLP